MTIKDVMPEGKIRKEIIYLIGDSPIEKVKELDLSYNTITDLSPLICLKQLKALDLSWNEITDILPLAKLEQLEWLNLSYNLITEIPPDIKFKQLKYLFLFGNEGINTSLFLEQHPGITCDKSCRRTG